jgi:biotin operon repressor
VVFEPWNKEVTFPRSPYLGDKEHEIRVWGRRRLFILERLIQLANKFTVHLLGSGLPSFYIADLGHMNFTLGLSGWTANDWSQAGNFDLMAPRAEVDEFTKRRVFDGLKETWFDSPDRLATRLGISRAAVLGALGAWSQAGRAMFDLAKGVYRVRELTREPLPMAQLRFANPREEAAAEQAVQGPVRAPVGSAVPPRPAGPARPGPAGRRRALSSFTLSVRPNHPPGVFHARSDQAAHLATRTVDRRPCNLAWHASLARS